MHENLPVLQYRLFSTKSRGAQVSSTRGFGTRGKNLPLPSEEASSPFPFVAGRPLGDVAPALSPFAFRPEHHYDPRRPAKFAAKFASKWPRPRSGESELTMGGTLSRPGQIGAAACLFCAIFFLPCAARGETPGSPRSGPGQSAQSVRSCHSAPDGDVFVSSRYGVYCYDPTTKAQGSTGPRSRSTVIPTTRAFVKGPKYEVGPSGLAFLGQGPPDCRRWQPQGGRRRADLQDPAKSPPSPVDWIKEEDAVHTLGPIKAGESWPRGKGPFTEWRWEPEQFGSPVRRTIPRDGSPRPRSRTPSRARVGW